PLPSTEHADAAWLVPLGGLIAAVLLGVWMYNLRLTIGARSDRSDRSSVVGRRSSVVVILALGLTLLPTAPFASPPDSRYLYLPVMAGALLITLGVDQRRKTKDEMHVATQTLRPSSSVLRPILVLCSLAFALALAWWAAGEL